MIDSTLYIFFAYIFLNVVAICYLAMQENGDDISKKGLTLPFTAFFIIQLLGVYFQLS